MNDIFKTFGVEVKQEPNTNFEEILGNFNEFWEYMDRVFDLKGIKLAYLQRMFEVSQRVGSPILICARCSKPIQNKGKLVLDQFSGVLYGIECFTKAVNRQSLLLTGKQGTCSASEFLITKCITCGREIRANKILLDHCGLNTRCCFCCEYLTMKYKAEQCPLEKHLTSVMFNTY